MNKEKLIGWLLGLLSAGISGGASAITVVVVDPNNFNLQAGLKNLASVFVVQALIGMALYLKQSPLPVPTDEKK